MNDRTKAIDILRRARDILSERLTDRILENSDAILEDALGLSYSSEIDSMYDQMGIRLAHVNQLLAQLPPEEEQGSDTVMEDDLPAAEAGSFVPPATARHEAHEAIPTPHLALPAPSELLQLAGPSARLSFHRFATRIFLGDVDGAALVLAELFELEVPRARKCAQVFYDAVRHNPDVLAKAAQLRRELQSGEYSTALVLLHECFGLQGLESISVMQTLKARLTRGV